MRTLELFVDRVRERSSLEITLRTDERVRLPLPQERELFRIAQEAIVNVERHADAHHVTITWSCDAGGARLDVADDGVGFPIGRAGRLDSYGLLGMRERAASIGATLDVESDAGPRHPGPVRPTAAPTPPRSRRIAARVHPARARATTTGCCARACAAR